MKRVFLQENLRTHQKERRISSMIVLLTVQVFLLAVAVQHRHVKYSFQDDQHIVGQLQPAMDRGDKVWLTRKIQDASCTAIQTLGLQLTQIAASLSGIYTIRCFRVEFMAVLVFYQGLFCSYCGID